MKTKPLEIQSALKYIAFIVMRNFAATNALIFTASYPACLSQNKMRFKTPDEPWLRNSTTKCFCKSDLTVECLILDEPACMDTKGKIRNNNEQWLNSSCVKCTCLNGTINCSQYIVNITYGLFKVNKFSTCEQCADLYQRQERTHSACKGKETEAMSYLVKVQYTLLEIAS